MDNAKKLKQDPDFSAVREEVEREFAAVTPDADLDSELRSLPNVEDEIGLEQVEYDQTVIDTVAAEDESDLDTDEEVSNRPQEFTESYGTGLQGQSGDRSGRFSRRGEHMTNQSDYTLTGGDVDANYEDAEAVGEEGVGGTVGTPDQDVVDELGAAVGIETDDRSFLRTNDRLEERDDRRWELEPKSSEDYQERRD